MVNKDAQFPLNDLKGLFVNGLCTAVYIMAGFDVGELSQEEADMNSFDVCGLMLLTGKSNALLSVSASAPTAARLVSYMTGMEIDHTDPQKLEVLCDGIAELVNIAAGSVKPKLAETEYFFVLSTPFSIVGKDIKYVAKRKSHQIACVIGSGEIALKLKVLYL